MELFVDSVVKLMPTHISLPTTDEQYRSLADGFYKYKYPNVIGAIDGSSIDVVVPAEEKIDYFTRKHRTSINLTALCDSSKKFLNIHVGQSGRSHDSHIFQCSPLGNLIHGQNKIPTQYHIIGDAAYGLHTNVMIPYPGSNIPVHQQLHNDIHSSTRMVIERTFGDLKNRWLRLQQMRCDITVAVKMVAACCVLHNICIDSGDITPTPNTHDIGGSHVLIVTNAAAKRDDIARHLQHAHGRLGE